MDLNLTENCFSLWAIFAAESEKERNKQSKNEENPTKTKGKTINMKENNKNKQKTFFKGGAGPLAPRKRGALAPIFKSFFVFEEKYLKMKCMYKTCS